MWKVKQVSHNFLQDRKEAFRNVLLNIHLSSLQKHSFLLYLLLLQTYIFWIYVKAYDLDQKKQMEFEVLGSKPVIFIIKGHLCLRNLHSASGISCNVLKQHINLRISSVATS